MKYSILIPTFNRADLLQKLITSIHKYSEPESYEILVLDNSEGKMKKPEFDEHNVRWYKMKKNYGNLSLNWGVNFANYPMIVILNDDVEVNNHKWLEKLHSYFVDTFIGIVGPQISKVNIANDTFIPGGSANSDEKYAFVESWCIMLPKDLYKKVNGFNSSLHLVYGEDFDLSMRVKRIGYKIIKAEDIPIVHLRYGTTRNKEYTYNPDQICAENLKILYDYWVENKQR